MIIQISFHTVAPFITFGFFARPDGKPPMVVSQENNERIIKQLSLRRLTTFQKWLKTTDAIVSQMCFIYYLETNFKTGLKTTKKVGIQGTSHDSIMKHICA